MGLSTQRPRTQAAQLFRGYTAYTLGFMALVALLATLEVLGLARQWIGYAFLLSTVGLYAGIGIMCRTSDPVEYYVAGRRVPAFYNGMATAADWMSVASFIGIAGTLYLSGYNGLAYILGWTGATCSLHFFWRLTCASLAGTPFQIFWAHATRVTSRA